MLQRSNKRQMTTQSKSNKATSTKIIRIVSHGWSCEIVKALKRRFCTVKAQVLQGVDISSKIAEDTVQAVGGMHSTVIQFKFQSGSCIPQWSSFSSGRGHAFHSGLVSALVGGMHSAVVSFQFQSGECNQQWLSGITSCNH